MSSFRKDVTIKQISGGAYVSGRWVEGFETSTTIKASVQPAGSNDISKTIQLLPEGRRQSELYRLYTSTKLNTLLNDQNPDIATIDGIDYEVTAEATWQNDVINHYKYIITRIKET